MTSIGLSQWIHDMDKYSYKYDDTRIGALGCNFFPFPNRGRHAWIKKAASNVAVNEYVNRHCLGGTNNHCSTRVQPVYSVFDIM